MSAPETDLLPEGLLEESLAPGRPDAEDFAAGVRRRIAERERARDADAADPARRAWPAWLKRAAAILPPGVVDLALLGKLGGAGGGAAAKAPALAWIAAPWAILLVVAASLVGAMRLTAKLDGGNSAPGGGRGRRGLLTGDPRLALFSMLVFVLPFGLMAIAIYQGLWFLFAAVFLLAAATVAAFVLKLSRVGFADRRTVAGVVSGALGQFVGIGFMLPSMLREQTGPLTTYVMPSLLVLGLLGAGRLSGELRGLRARLATPVLIGAALLLPLLTLYGTQRRFGSEPEQLEAWVEELDSPVGALFDWAALGHARFALGPERFDQLDLGRARAVLERAAADGQRLHPVTALGAWRAGLLPADALGEFRRPENLIRNAVARGKRRTFFRDSDLLEVLSLSADGSMDPERHRFFRGALEGSLPAPGERSAIEKARVALDYAGALGVDDYVERHRDALRAILAGGWSVDGTSYAPPGGFGNWLDAREGRERHIHPDTTDTLVAVELMTVVGVPVPVDLATVDAFLSEQTKLGWSGDPLIGDVEAALARHLLRRSFELPEPTWTDRLRRETVFLAALVLVALSLWIVWRAPQVRPVEDGPLERGIAAARR